MSNENRKRQPPLLLTTHYGQNAKQSIHRLLDSQSHTMCIPVLFDKRVLASTHGWLVLMDLDYGECCLWNPGSKNIIELPRLEEFYLYEKCVLSKPPTEPDCHVLFNSESALQQSFCMIGDVEFVQKNYPLTEVASFHGKIYGVTTGYKFVTIDFVGRTMELTPILINREKPFKAPHPRRNWVVCHENYLIESPSGNELLMVIKDFTHKHITDSPEIRVFRVDINRMECTELDDIGDQTIFIGFHGSGFCCSSGGTNTIKPNSIYYTAYSGEYVYVYNLDDKSTSSWLPHVGRFIDNFWVDLEELSLVQ